MEPATILIDGECGLCTRASHFGMRHAAPGRLRFLAIQSPEGRDLLRRHGLEAAAADTMVAVVGERCYLRSAGVVQVAKRLRWPWRAQAALWLVPRPLRDAGYRWVAKRRNRFG
jgi:predicted DCC family thiol-disulfide oxidoreductase YuxK